MTWPKSWWKMAESKYFLSPERATSEIGMLTSRMAKNILWPNSRWQSTNVRALKWDKKIRNQLWGTMGRMCDFYSCDCCSYDPLAAPCAAFPISIRQLKLQMLVTIKWAFPASPAASRSHVIILTLFRSSFLPPASYDAPPTLISHSPAAVSSDHENSYF